MCKESTFSSLNRIDCKAHIEQKNGLSYLSWAWAWKIVKSNYPDAGYTIRHWGDYPYLISEMGILVETAVTINGETQTMWLPVMDSNNRAMKTSNYEVMAWSAKERKFIPKTVLAATMFDINTAIMRCLVKNLAMFGLGLYIYAGEDIPTEVNIDEEAQEKRKEEIIQAIKSETKAMAENSAEGRLKAILIGQINKASSRAEIDKLWKDNPAFKKDVEVLAAFEERCKVFPKEGGKV